jgi:hypothetical protein
VFRGNESVGVNFLLIWLSARKEKGKKTLKIQGAKDTNLPPPFQPVNLTNPSAQFSIEEKQTTRSIKQINNYPTPQMNKRSTTKIECESLSLVADPSSFSLNSTPVHNSRKRPRIEKKKEASDRLVILSFDLANYTTARSTFCSLDTGCIYYPPCRVPSTP